MRRSLFRRLFLATLLAFAAINAVSYFLRSDDGKLPGGVCGVERIGFPWLVWQDGAEPNGGFATLGLGADGYFDYGALALNAALGLAASTLVGLLGATAFKPGAHGKPVDDEGPDRSEEGPPQFSLRSLLLATAVVAGALGLVRGASHEAGSFLLVAIYLIGPSLVVCSAWLARRRKRVEQRLVACAALATLVAAALAVGTYREQGDFTRVLLGLYIYWVPQCVALLAAHAAWQHVHPWRG